MARKKKTKEVFSVTKAVRANAREKVGQPKPARVIPERVTDGERQSKHKDTLGDLLEKREE